MLIGVEHAVSIAEEPVSPNTVGAKIATVPHATIVTFQR